MSRRILILADFACASGFAQVAQNVVVQLLKEKEVQYQIDIVAINYYGVPNEWLSLYPTVRLFPASIVSNGDLFGREAYLAMLGTGAYDLTWVLQDTFIVEVIGEKIKDIRTKLITENKKVFKFIYYFPIDATPKENWITKSVSIADIPVAYTEYGKNEVLRWDKDLAKRLRVIPHGVDTTKIKPLPKDQVRQFRHDWFDGLADDRFLITNVNRNQPRKDVARTLQIFSLFKKQAPEALLYLHMKAKDVAYDINEIARNFDLIPEKDYIVPPGFDEHEGVSVEMLNFIYNSSDLVMTTTLGEGWGLSMTEALAARVPVIAPNHTSLTEILTNRGFLVTAGKTQNDWIALTQDNERLRPLANVNEYVDKLMYIRNNYQEALKLAEAGHGFVINNWTWDLVGQQWRDLFKNVFPAEKKVGRNDLCFCKSGKKYKNCHYGK